MPTQSADDLGRGLDGIWLGPPNSWRWPVDWSFKKWGLFSASLLVSFVLMALVVPMGVVAFAAAWWAARTMAPTLNADAPRRWHWALLGAMGFVLFMLVPHPKVWMLPVWLPLVFVVAPAIGFISVRLYGRYLTWNTPMRYWLRLPRLSAGGPRLQPARMIDPRALDLGMPAAVIRPSQKPPAPQVQEGAQKALEAHSEPEEAVVAFGFDVVADEFVTIARADSDGTVQVEQFTLEPKTYPMPPAKHPFLVRIPGGLYCHRLNYKITWGPQ